MVLLWTHLWFCLWQKLIHFSSFFNPKPYWGKCEVPVNHWWASTMIDVDVIYDISNHSIQTFRDKEIPTSMFRSSYSKIPGQEICVLNVLIFQVFNHNESVTVTPHRRIFHQLKVDIIKTRLLTITNSKSKPLLTLHIDAT